MTGAGIAAASRYRPRYRARAGSEVYVLAGDDEDEVTMAHAALSSLNFQDQGTAALFYSGRQENSSALAEVLGPSFSAIHLVADVAAALSLAADAVAAGTYQQAVVVAPALGSPMHDGAAAFSIEAGAPLAALQGRGFRGAIASVPAYFDAMGQAVAAAGWKEHGPNVVCFPHSSLKTVAAAVKAAGLTARLRSSGMSAPLEGLYEALASAQPGDRILFLDDCNTVRAIAFEVRGRMPRIQSGEGAGVEVSDFPALLRRRTRPSVGAAISDVFRAREAGAVLRLEAGYCTRCDQYLYPAAPICPMCRKSGHLQACRLPRHGSILTFTDDTLAGSDGEPVRIAVVDFSGQGRFLCQVTDYTPGTAEPEMEVELVLRRLASAPVNQPYYWKCRPTVLLAGEGAA